MSLKLILKKYCFPLILLVSIFVGMITGWIVGSEITVIKPLGEVFINMLFTIVIPLVFFTISSSIANMNSLKRLGKILGYMLVVFGITSLIASIFMLIGVFIINPVGNLNIQLVDGVKESVNLKLIKKPAFTVGFFVFNCTFNSFSSCCWNENDGNNVNKQYNNFPSTNINEVI